MTATPRNVCTVAWGEFSYSHSLVGGKQRNLCSSPGDVVPFVRVRMPVGCMHRTGLQSRNDSGKRRGDRIFLGRCDMDCAPGRTDPGLLGQERKKMCPRCIQYVNGASFRAIASDHVTLPDVNLSGRNFGDGVFGQTECLREHRRIQSAHPVAESERSVLSIQTVVEGKDGVARLGPQGLDRMGMPLWKIPEIAGGIIGYLCLTFRIDDSYLAMATQDVRPFRGVVPMHLSHTT